METDGKDEGKNNSPYSADPSHTNRKGSDPAQEFSRLQGMRIRDEFICPITFELFRNPCLASDGHTYEKHALEKWLKTSKKSPRTGEELIPTVVIQNINLRKIIEDMLSEGGASLYQKDWGDRNRVIDVTSQKVIELECLGPPDSDWNQNSFQVNYRGCVGGRKNQKHGDSDDVLNRDFIQFKDITVSRRHFEIMKVDSAFSIRDLGSAGGTYIRIPFGERKQLHPGMIILLGKHQFIVSSIDDNSQMLNVTDSGDSKNNEIRRKEKKNDWIDSTSDEKNSQSSNLDEKMSKLEIVENDSKNTTSSSTVGSSSRRLTLTCCAPDGSPLQGRSFFVGVEGAGLGRKASPQNTILLFSKVEEIDPATGEYVEKVFTVDTAISSEHARVEFDNRSNSFFLCDGTTTKPSTNGSWFRLSGPHQESPLHMLSPGSEVLIGSVRFKVKETIALAEHDVKS